MFGMTGWDVWNGVVPLSFRLSPDVNRDAWRNPLEVVTADSWLLWKEIPRLATLARNDDKRRGIPPRLSACGGSLGMTG